MVDVRTFQAASMQEALEMVRREMGIEAVVLQTRELERRRLLWRRRQVEVTAGLGINTVSPMEEPAVTPAFPSSQQASALIDRRALIPRPEAGIDLLEEPPQEPTPCSAHPHKDMSAGLVSDTTSHGQQQLAERLDTIEQLLTQFGQRSTGLDVGAIPPGLFHLYTQLIEADVAEQRARELMLELQQSVPSDVLADVERSQQQLSVLVESHLHCAGPITIQPGTPKVVALVGPTGVGKTTTIAKLAANFRLRDGIKLGLVTVDTYRVAAVEQLRTYADIIDLPMKVVTNPLEMRRAIDELADMDLVLVDTAGRSPREELQLQELKALLHEARVDEVHLVLSLATNPRVLRMTAEKFGQVGVTSLILTKLDEAVGMGALLNVASDLDCPMSYLTTGQNVPDDIETASASRTAGLILGTDDLFHRRGPFR